MRTIQFGFQMHHGAGPIQAFEQRLELLDPQVPLILDRAVTGAEVNHLGLVQAFSGLLATGKHLAPEKWPGLARRQLAQHLVVDLPTQTALRRASGWPVANAAINDGFGLHAGTPENQGCLLPQRRVPRKELLGNLVILPAGSQSPGQAWRGPLRMTQASAVISSARLVSTMNGN